MGRLRTDNSDRFRAKYVPHDLNKEFAHSNPEPNRFMLKYSNQMNRQHAIKALHHPNEVFAGYTAVGSSPHLKRSDLENYLKSGPSEHVKRQIRERFKVEATPKEERNWMDSVKMEQYKYHPEEKE